MLQHVPQLQCRACLHFLQQAATTQLLHVPIASTSSAPFHRRRNLSSSSRRDRRDRSSTSSQHDIEESSSPSLTSSSKLSRKYSKGGSRAGRYGGGNSAGGGRVRPTSSAFNLSSEVPEANSSEIINQVANKKHIANALYEKQQELILLHDGGANDGSIKGKQKFKSQISKHSTGNMLEVLEAIAKRLALNKTELLQLAKTWAKEHPLHARKEINPKGKNRLSTHGSLDLDAVERDMQIYGERAIDRAVLSQFLEWIRTQDMTSHTKSSSSSSFNAISFQLAAVAETLDLRYPGEWYPAARNMKRKIILHVGPTNSGKTYNALCALAKARTGAFGGPLRLLAAEVYNRFNAGTIGGLSPENPRICNLITGEEKKIHDELCGLESCTVEMMSLQKLYDVVVIDEIQMIADPGRGSAWTQALLGLRAKELHLCGEPSVVDLIKRIGESLGDEVEVKNYQRLSPLTVAKRSISNDWSRIKRGDCVVAFSRSGIFDIKKTIEQNTGLRVAVAYGGLPPEVREEQARGFNAPEEEDGYDVLVASDAIGMGLNLSIKRVIFTTLKKWDGRQEVPLSISQIKQIGGRAGRFGMSSKTSSPSGPDEIDPATVPNAVEDDQAQGDVGEDSLNGVVTCLEEEDMPYLRKAMAATTQPIHRAALHPQSTHLENFATLLPRSTTQAHVFEIFPVLAISGPEYFVPSFGSPLKLAETLSSVQRLTIAERWLLGNAPVNLRDEEVVRAFSTFVKFFSVDETLKMTQWINAQGMSTTLQDYRDAEDAFKAAKEEKGEDAPLPAKSARFITATNLIILESLHRCIGLYLWLHNRFALRFPQAAEARLFKAETQAAIDFVLQHMTRETEKEVERKISHRRRRKW